MQKRSGNCKTHRDPNQIFPVMHLFAMALQSTLSTQQTEMSLWVEGLGVHRGEFPVLGQIAEFKASLLRDLAAGWSWLCETGP